VDLSARLAHLRTLEVDAGAQVVLAEIVRQARDARA
jgi:hypothetical protein